MSVAMTNCGRLGWVSDARGYRYDACDPLTGMPWPAMQAAFVFLADAAAMAAGFAPFAPEACLVNRYVRGARMSLHVDRDERSGAVPIVSVSLGLPATFNRSKKYGGTYTVRERADAAMNEFAPPLDPGTTLYAWTNFPSGMLAAFAKAPPGLIVQETGTKCTSMHPTATSPFGHDLMEIHSLPGARGITSFGSTEHEPEAEITMPPGTRYFLDHVEDIIHPSDHPCKKFVVMMLPTIYP